MNKQTLKLEKQVRAIILFFMIALVISGATAIPAETELTILIKIFPVDTGIGRLLTTVLTAVQDTGAHYSYLFYGYDWLAFAHFVIAIAFVGVLIDPAKNIWVIQFGMIACIAVLPFALIAGGIRGLPVWWRLIDCSFGIAGFIPLWICHRKVRRMEELIRYDRLNIIF